MTTFKFTGKKTKREDGTYIVEAIEIEAMDRDEAWRVLQEQHPDVAKRYLLNEAQ